ncbi:hypothetical protein GCM10023317_60320 [Actinopolymorpha pittospori]|uniref:Uncharacterized protein n=1 Tax=Actinopolymorpha pittospori TaxID=648752 RepID=A0A927R9X5_9ACTN|nr:hypothetical protein [Actinopolymorpha pittospori]
MTALDDYDTPINERLRYTTLLDATEVPITFYLRCRRTAA